MQNLTEIISKPLLHQIKNANLLLSTNKMAKYTCIVILNVTLMIHNKRSKCQKSVCISANVRLQNTILPTKH